MSVAVANASPLIALARIDRFYLLKKLFRKIVVPEAAWVEVVIRGAGKPAADLTLSAEQEAWLHQIAVKDTLAVAVLRATLGPGEAEAIVLAQETQATWVLLDDDLARAHARRIGLRVKGTAGILLAAYQAGFINDLKTELNALRAEGFWLKDSIYNAILSEARVKNA